MLSLVTSPALVSCGCIKMPLIRFVLSAALISFSSSAFADAYVCVDTQGNRSFSSTPCDKKGLQTAPKQVAVSNPKVINAMVIAEKREGDNQDPTIPAGQIKMDRELRLGTPATVFLITMMIATAGLFGLLFMRFFRAHHGKLSLKRTDRD